MAYTMKHTVVTFARAFFKILDAFLCMRFPFDQKFRFDDFLISTVLQGRGQPHELHLLGFPPRILYHLIVISKFSVRGWHFRSLVVIGFSVNFSRKFSYLLPLFSKVLKYFVEPLLTCLNPCATQFKSRDDLF